jgi:sulfoxide reductase heme-binding subunit YedZ
MKRQPASSRLHAMSSSSVPHSGVPRVLPGLQGPRIVYLSIVGFGLMCGAGFGMDGSVEDAVRLAIRETARSTLLIFATVFATSAIRRRWRTPATNFLIRNRRYLGLSAAVSHGYHLIFILVLYGLGKGGDTSLLTVIGGGWGFLLLAAMAATSNDVSQRTLGRNWRRLHLLGMWTVWVVYAVSYFPAAHTDPLALAGSVVVGVSLALRLWPKPGTRT